MELNDFGWLFRRDLLSTCHLKATALSSGQMQRRRISSFPLGTLTSKDKLPKNWAKHNGTWLQRQIARVAVFADYLGVGFEDAQKLAGRGEQDGWVLQEGRSLSLLVAGSGDGVVQAGSGAEQWPSGLCGVDPAWAHWVRCMAVMVL